MEPLSKIKSEPTSTAEKRFERLIVIESADKVIASFTLPAVLEDHHTSGWLLAKCIEMLQKKSSNPQQQIIALKTKDADLIHFNYLLTLPNYKLSFLPEKTILVPIYANPKTSEITLSDFEVVALLGRGGFAKVYLVRSSANGQFYALKQLKKATFASKKYMKLYRERNVMAETKSDHAVKLHYAFQTPKYCYFVMDYLPCGTLLSLKNKLKKLNENEARFYISEILLGLRDLHAARVIYRDLKAENVLLDLNGHIKLCDFGLAKIMNNTDLIFGSVCGTAQFLSPEMIGNKGYDLRVDYYAVGVAAYELITGRLPFPAKESEGLFEKIAKDEPTYPEDMSPVAKDFISRLLCKDPSKRLGANGGVQEIMEHAWFKTVNFKRLDARSGRVPFLREPSTKNLKRIEPDFNIEAESEDDIQKNSVEVERRIKLFSFRASREFSFEYDEEDVDEAEQQRKLNAKIPTHLDFDKDYSKDTQETSATEQIPNKGLLRYQFGKITNKFSIS